MAIFDDFITSIRTEFGEQGAGRKFEVMLTALALSFSVAASSVLADTNLDCGMATNEAEQAICSDLNSTREGDTSEQSITNRGAFYLQISSYDYVETNVMSKTATLPFLGLGYNRNFQFMNNNFDFNIEGQFGLTNYSGTGTTKGDQTLIFLTQLQRSWRYDDIMLSAGLGYRFLYDDWGGQTTSTSLPTYDRRSDYFFGSVGSIIELEADRSLVLQYRHLFQGIQTSGLHSTTWDGNLTKIQPEGYGVTIEYELDHKSLVYIDYWNIANSAFDDQGQGFFEPANRTIQIGLRHTF